MGEISLRHIPDLSDASALADFSDSSFQIPAAAHAVDDLLADDTINFFSQADDAMNTPAPPSRPFVQPPLTLAELTPRSKPLRSGAVRSSLRPRPGVPTPHRAVVASELSTALSEDLSPFRKQDPSFEIPLSQNHEDLLMADDGAQFFGVGESSMDVTTPHPDVPLQSNQCRPGPAGRLAASPTFSPSPQRPPSIDTGSSEPVSGEGDVERSTHVDAVVATGDPPPAPTTAPIPTVSGSVPEASQNHTSDVGCKKGKVKAPATSELVERHKKHSGGDKAKRKRVHPSAAVTKPAKLKPLTASLARRLSNSGKKPVSAVRRRPVQTASSSARPAGPSGPVADKAHQPISHPATAPFRSGGLADTLMSYGQKLIANTQNRLEEQRLIEHDEETDETPVLPDLVPAGDAPPVTSSEQSASDQPIESVSERGYLTLSQLSPRKPIAAESPEPMLDSQDDREAPAPALDQPPPVIVSSDRPPSPMRTSFKRAGSPAEEPEAHTRKRSKTTSGPSASNASKETRAHKPPLRPSRARNAPAASTSSGPSGVVRARRAVSATIAVAVANRAQNSDGARKPGLASSRSLSTNTVPGREDGLAAMKVADAGQGLSSRNVRNAATLGGNSRSGHRSQRENQPSGQERPADEKKSSRSNISAGDRPPANSLPAKPTKPTEFQFATSTRVEARSHGGNLKGGELDKSAPAGGSTSLRRSRQAPVHPIPDFKALHAAQESVLTQKRAEIQVTKPVEFGLATEVRAQERERFEEARRARERELERLAEERRRQREMEEEVEIRELRRRAVPKANEVPEWYAFAPKRAKAADAGS